MGLFQLVYWSRPFGFDASVLAGILVTARARNARDAITGALICRADIYLQLLEGPESAVEAAFGRIARDDRHLEVERLFATPVADRLFPGWAMRDDPARSWMWSADAVAGGALGRAARPELIGVFERMLVEPV